VERAGHAAIKPLRTRSTQHAFLLSLYAERTRERWSGGASGTERPGLEPAAFTRRVERASAVVEKHDQATPRRTLATV
jgi:hypothetical protein